MVAIINRHRVIYTNACFSRACGYMVKIGADESRRCSEAGETHAFAASRFIRSGRAAFPYGPRYVRERENKQLINNKVAVSTVILISQGV